MCANGVVAKRRTHEDLRRRGLRRDRVPFPGLSPIGVEPAGRGGLDYGWNAMEVVVTILLGVQAGSLALIAFGLDSIIEIFASTVVIRNLHDERSDPGDRREELDPESQGRHRRVA